MDTSLHESYVDARTFERDYSLSTRLYFLWIKEGKLTAYKPSKRKTLVKRSDVERVLEASRAGAVVAEVRA
jgi:hypothetical protein